VTKTLLVGGSGGIGSAIERKLKKYAPSTLIHKPSPGQMDVTNQVQVEEWISEMGPYEHLVYAAGDNHLEWAHHMSVLDMQRLFDVNVCGLIRIIGEQEGWSNHFFKRVVVIGSDAAEKPMRTSAAYNASKAALHAATLCYAREVAGRTAVNIVAPGKIADTSMTKYVENKTFELRQWTPDELRDYETAQIPVGRYGTSAEVAEVVAWLLYSAPEYLTGQVIKVNGGR
jgi:3-oxoacyl-[acyl-carrier protein] reductase